MKIRFKIGALILVIATVALLVTTWSRTRSPVLPQEGTSRSDERISAKDSPAATGSNAGLPAQSSARVESADAAATLDLVLEKIHTAAVEYSETELPKFERWLASSNPEIRMAAAEGLLNSGLANGAPLLRAASARATDPGEAQEMDRAASILELPPATERLIRARKERRLSSGTAAPSGRLR